MCLCIHKYIRDFVGLVVNIACFQGRIKIAPVKYIKATSVKMLSVTTTMLRARSLFKLLSSSSSSSSFFSQSFL